MVFEFLEDHVKYITLLQVQLWPHIESDHCFFLGGLILKADGTLNEAAIPNVTKALQVTLCFEIIIFPWN